MISSRFLTAGWIAAIAIVVVLAGGVVMLLGATVLILLAICIVGMGYALVHGIRGFIRWATQ